MTDRFVKPFRSLFSLAAPLLGLLWVLCLRLNVFLWNPLPSLGYDFGFYSFAARRPEPFAWSAVIPVLDSGYSNLLFWTGHALHLDGGLVLWGSYMLALCAIPLGLYYRFKNEKPAAFWAMLLYGLSLVQLEAYSQFLWKTMAALALAVWAWALFSHGRRTPAVLLFAAAASLHRTTALIFVLALAAYGAAKLLRRRTYMELAAWACGALFLAGCAFLLDAISPNPLLSRIIYNSNELVRAGLFAPRQHLLSLLWPGLLVALPGIWLSIQKRRNMFMLCLVSVSGLWLMLQLPFYRRVSVYFDLGLIVFGAVWLGSLKMKNFRTAALVILFVMLAAVRSWDYAKTRQPLISSGEVAEISSFRESPGFILTPSANDAPWLLAYSGDYKIGAPGLLKDVHSKAQWEQFWNGSGTQAFLAAYPRPLYIYQRSIRYFTDDSVCLRKVSENFSEYTCSGQ